MDWDACFIDRAPALAAYAHVAEPLRLCRRWPDLPFLQSMCDERGIMNARGVPLRLVSERSDKAYEARIYADAEMHVRQGLWHDLFNLLAWLAFPETKAALNARHCDRGDADPPTFHPPRVPRSRVRDALTLLDENGAIVASSDAGLLDLVRAFEWKQLFWHQRARLLRSMQVFTIGHGLAEQALAPYIGLCAHSVLLAVPADFDCLTRAQQVTAIDTLAARLVRRGDSFVTPQALAPLPVLGMPGWWPDNAHESFYDNVAYFRTGRRAQTERTSSESCIRKRNRT
jgi:hypothetical protein